MMKLPKLKRVRESLASRISVWIVLCVVVIITIAAVVGNNYLVKTIKLEENVKANGILYIVGQRIDAGLISVEIAVRNHLNDIKENLDKPDVLYRITQEMLEDNPSIVGSAIAFKPNYFPEQGRWFSPYSYREDNAIRSKQLGNADYDYFSMDWYQTTDSLKRNYWSEPYFDRGGGEMVMTTYSCPLMDEDGNVIAVFTADILLDYLSELLNVNYYEHANAFIISHNGTFISHPIKELVLNQTIFSIAEQTGHPELIEIGQEMIDGKSGMREWNSPVLGDSFIFFVPSEHTGWSLAIVCQAAELFKGVYNTALFLGTVFILMMLVLTYLLRRSVHRLIAPLTTFTQAVDEVAQGNLNATLPEIHTKDEMQRLHHSFCTMQQSLMRQMEELKQVNEAKGRIEGELQVAKDIQLSMLPKAYLPSSNDNNFDIYGQLLPAREVGGDLYDFFISKNKLFFCVGDVSGKGVPAALVMAMTLSHFRNVACYEDDLEKIIKAINKASCDGNESMMFITYFMGVLDLSSGLLRYCNAGHHKPFIVGEGVTELPAKPDLPLGVSEDAPYVVREYALPAGFTLFLYTDGLTEAMNAQREQFGRQRLINSLHSCNDCKGMVEHMTQTVHQFVGDAPQSDDLTMLAIRYKC